jgi:hypothetical protein
MMDRQQVVKQCDMEVMKMAMLKHEETFRQQVIKRDAHSRQAHSFCSSPWRILSSCRWKCV